MQHQAFFYSNVLDNDQGVRYTPASGWLAEMMQGDASGRKTDKS